MPDKGKDDKLIFSGVVTEALPDTTFRVKLDNDKVILSYLSGKMRLHYIRVVPGDKVNIEMSPHDLTRGRIVLFVKPRGISRNKDNNENSRNTNTG